MITKEILDGIIKRRIDEGKTLSINKIDDEAFPKGSIEWASEKYYGSWTKARNAHEPEITKEYVTKELLRLQSEGHSMKSSEFDSTLYRNIVEVFGGYKQAKDEMGITNNRKKGSGPRRRELSDVIAELEGAYENIKTKQDYNTKYRHIGDYSREHLGNMYEIFNVAGLEIPVTIPRKRSPVYWTEERIRKSIKEAVQEQRGTASYSLQQKGYGGVVDAVKRRYGTWNAGLVALGYEVAYEYRSPDDNLTKLEAKEKVLSALASGVKPTREDLTDSIEGLGTAIKRHFGSIANLKEYCGFCAFTDKPAEVYTKSVTYRPELASEKGVKREIIRMWYIGAPMNYTHIRKKRQHVLRAVNEHIGSWKKAVESVGLDYDDISKQVTTNVLSECGTVFEELFAEILTELGYEFHREGNGVDEIIPGFTLKPDFILPNWRWIDCKLSEWTDIRETIIRYHSEYPNGITIVYLRGKNHRIDRGRKWKYEHISVYQFTKLLPRERREYYENILREIERKADEGAVAS